MQKNIIFISQKNDEYLKNLNEDCYVLDATLDEDFCREFMVLAQKKDIVVLFVGERAVECAKKFGADGVVCEASDKGVKSQVEDLRKILGKKAIVGLVARNRRHEAMVVSEAEPDFVVFKVWSDGIEKTKELLEWYSDFFLIQSVAWVIDEDVEKSTLMADFIMK